jgi:hypothetical protein
MLSSRRSSRPRFLLRALALLLLPLLLASTSRGGDGEIVDGKLDLLVYFTYDEDQPQDWEAVFTEYSKLLGNATEGGLQLGTVTFTRVPDLMDRADVWVLDDFSGARAHLNGLGRNGRHITISQIHESTSGSAIGQFGLLHESGHYVWGVFDEYRGYIGNTPGSHVAHYCASSFGDVACVMDGGTTVYPNNHRTEFCTDYALGFATTRHFPGTDDAQGNAIRTDQEYILRCSCWRQIENSGVGGLVHPLVDPSGEPPPHESVAFDYSRYAEPLAMALVLDTSGSMSAENKLARAILGAQVGVGLLRDDEFLTVVGFADEPTIVYPIRSMTESRKNSAIEAIDELVADGGTHLGIAVLEAVDQLGEVDGGKEFLVVVSDGISHDPDIDDPAVLAALREADHPVFTIALGAFPDDEALIVAAAATGGRFFKVTDAESLPGIFATIFSIAGSGTTVLEGFGGGIGPLGVRSENFEVSEIASSVRVSVNHPPGADLGLRLLAPDGAIFDFDDPQSPAERFESDVHKTMRISAPAVGVWEARISEPFGVATTADFLAFVESRTLNVTPIAASDSVDWPDPMQIEVSVVARFPVGGSEVDARVTRPDGSVAALGFFDDGLAVHGDEKRDDGVYSARFAGYRGDGGYLFDIDVVNVDGSAASNLECGWYGRGGDPESDSGGLREEGQSSDPIEPFVAHARYSIVLRGQEEPVQTGAADLSLHASLDPVIEIEVATAPPTAVAGFSLQVSPDEALQLEHLRVDLDPGLESVTLLEGMALHLDSDGDGELDVPSVPLAFGRLTGGDRELLFEQENAPLALLAAGENAHFLLTLGRSSGLGTQGGVVRPSRGPLVPPAIDRGIARWIPFAVLLLLLGIAHRWRRGARAVPQARLAARVVLVSMAALLPACGAGGGDGEAGVEMTIASPGIELSGAATLDRIEAAGDPLVFVVRAR